MLAALLVSAMVTLGVGATVVGGVVIARHRAQAAADLAALAGASRLPAGPAAACLLADSVGSAMGASLGACDVENLDLVVTCTVRLGGWAEAAAVEASARAGPDRLR